MSFLTFVISTKSPVEEEPDIITHMLRSLAPEISCDVKLSRGASRQYANIFAVFMDGERMRDAVAFTIEDETLVTAHFGEPTRPIPTGRATVEIDCVRPPGRSWRMSFDNMNCEDIEMIYTRLPISDDWETVAQVKEDMK